MEFHVEYPILMHTTYHPKRNKIMVCNIAMNQPKKLVDLGEYRFVKFVETSYIPESTNANWISIFFLVKHRKEKYIQLM